MLNKKLKLVLAKSLATTMRIFVQLLLLILTVETARSQSFFECAFYDEV